MTVEKYKILHLEDVASDAELVARSLKKNNIYFDHLVIDSREEFLDALNNFSPDLILCDHSLPAFNSFEALRIIKARNLHIPFIVITATMSEEVALTVVREGADDYILKDRLSRLPFVVSNAIDKYRYEKDRKRLIDDAHQKEAATKKQLQKLSDKLLLATRAAGIGTWEFDTALQKFVADDILLDIYGIGDNEFDGTLNTWSSYIHYDDKDQVLYEFQQSLMNNPNLDVSFRIVRRDGKTRWIKAVAIAQEDDAGNVYRLVGTNQDITAARLAEIEIRESEEKYRSFFENSMDGILITATDGNIISANPAACAMFQMTEANICAAGLFALVDMTEARMLHAIEERQRTGKATVEITCIRKDGSRFPGETTSSVYRNALGENKTSMIIRDITERKNAEEQLHSTSSELKRALADVEKIMDASLDIICSIDEDGRFVSVSSAAKSIWGYEPHELKGTAYLDCVFHPDKEITIKAAIGIMDGIAVTIFENRYVKKDGSIVPMLWSARWDAAEKMMYCVAKDATEKKRMESAFDFERQRLNELFKYAPASVGVFKGPEHVFEIVNRNYLKLTGRKNIIGKTVREVFPEIENQGFFELLDQVYKTGVPFIANERLVQVDIKSDGLLVDKYLNFVYHPYRDNENTIAGIFFFVVDVTEQVEARKKVEESEKRFKQLIQDLPEAVYTCDAEGKIQLYNKAAVALWGRTPEIGKDVWCGSHKMYTVNGAPILHDATPLAMTMKNGRSNDVNEIVVEQPNGERRHVRTSPILNFDSDKKLIGAINMLVDITHIKLVEEDLRTSNERFQIVTKATNDGIWDWNLTTNEIYWNQSYERISGYTKTNRSLATETWFENIHPDDYERVKSGVMNAINNGDSLWEDEYRYIKADNEIAIVFDRGYILYDSQQKPVRFVGAMEEITGRKRIETEREQLIEHLVKRNNDLKQFTYITSHNFRAPLSNLIGLLSLVDHKTLNDSNKEIVKMFETSTQQLNKTINDLIQILIIKNNLDVNIVHNNIDQALTETCELLTQEIKETETTIIRNINVHEVVLNKSYLQSILLNLVSNAIKYRSANRKLVVEISTEQKQNGEILMVIKDNGSGIDLRRHRDQIFGLYQRFHSTIVGAGLGLYMVKTQIMALGGKIEVESEEENGTTFYITFKP